MSARVRSALARGAMVALLSATATAQSPERSLEVRVTDPAGAAVPDAAVRLASSTGAQRHVTTDSSGRARFDALAGGTYFVEVDATGFARAARRIAVWSDDATVVVPLALGGIAEHVVVTAVGRPQTTGDLAKSLTVIDADEIDARGEFAVADALRTAAGATVQQLGGPGSFASIKLRGLREQDTAVLIDGARMRDASSPQGDATAFVGELYVASLDRIELLRGSGSSIHGSHAVGGAVNLITRAAGDRPSVDVAAQAGGLGFSRATVHGGGSLGSRLSLNAGVAYTRAREGVGGDDRSSNTSVQGRVDARLPRGARATARVYSSDAASSVNESPSAIGVLPPSGYVIASSATFLPGADDPDNTRDSTFVSSLFRLEGSAAGAIAYTVSLHHLSTDRLFRDGPRGVSAFEPAAATSSRFKGGVTTLEVRADREWSVRQITTAGYEFEREAFESEARPVNATLAWDARIRQNSHALFLQHEIGAGAARVAGSIRGQAFTLDSVALTPAERAPFAAGEFEAPPRALTADVAAVWAPTPAHTRFRAHAGSSYRAPAAFERAGVSFGSRGYSVFGDPRLAPERAVSFDAGVDQPLFDGSATVSATWFRTRLTRVIAFGSVDRATDLFGRSSGYRNADGRTASGLEVGISCRPLRDVRATLAYTFVDAPPPAGDRDALPRAAAIVAHQFAALVTWLRGPLQLSIDLESAGDHYVTLFHATAGARAYRFDGIRRADISASYRLSRSTPRLRLVGTVENLFDRERFVQGFAAAGRVARGGAAVTF